MTTNSLSFKGSSTGFGIISSSNLLLNHVLGFELKSTLFALRFSAHFTFVISSEHTSLLAFLVTHTSDNSSFTTINFSPSSLLVSFVGSKSCSVCLPDVSHSFSFPSSFYFSALNPDTKRKYSQFSLFSSNETLLTA